MDLKEIQNSNLDLILQKDKLIILEFYTTWCPSCKMLAITLEEFEEENPDVFILQVNADENKELASVYKIKNAPTMLFIKKGEVLDTHQGFLDIDELNEIVSALI